ncbi:acyl-CoA synthetase short-chain family member 3, mitochondrial-like isoform X2 [Hydractinia symbiolongicarpus]|uniref:acyl-CoA synthetase short-chain family member 3, mitochondrial-like isoform X2 n=1 Tax=Hydractinia symbiolongicarpus TaxID=13093 RepID=UPI00254C87F1|nr:acyl-CoA synthetase short-chain family member 3, mitochondrial-like isoform X2 [Hydractinia symbiolongicarpus]
MLFAGRQFSIRNLRRAWKAGQKTLFQASRTFSCSCRHHYETHFRRSVETPEEFWEELAQDINWFKKYERVLDNSNPPFTKWFVGGEMNTCYEGLDVHVANGFGDDKALIYDSPVTETKRAFTYDYLKEQASKFARVLINNGVQKGDRVIIYMPMIPEAIIAMYGCARVGAVHSVVFGGFAPKELARRIDDAEPVVMVTASCGLEPNRVLPYEPLVKHAVEIASHKPHKIITVDREQGIVRPNGGHAVALKWSMKNIYNIHPNDIWWAASDIGWVVGHSYIVYAPLFNKSTSILFEGKPVGSPNASTFFRIIDEYDVSALFTAPTAIRVIRNEDPDGDHAKAFTMERLQALFLAGENADINLLKWCKNVFRKPVVDHWWQTESGWPITSHHLGLGLPSDYKLGSIGKPTPGWNVKVLSKQYEECKPGELGQIFVKLPLPPGAMSTLWNKDDRFIESYFETVEGFYDTSDAGMVDENGYVSIGGRIDDVINVAGHRLSTQQMERAIAQDPDIMEQAVIGVKDEVKGLIPVGLVVLRKGCQKDEETVKKDVIQVVRSDVGPVAAFKKVIILPVLPKTRAGKFIRGTLKKIMDGDEYTVPQTIENPDDFAVVEAILKKSVSFDGDV